ncbi:unnamed protein product [Calypogeia fissa]
MKWVARFKDRVTSPFASPVPTLQDINDDGTFRTRPETEQDFKRYWDDFRSSNSEKEKEEALEIAVDVFCKLSKKNCNAPQLVSVLADARLFPFVVARALVTDIDNLRRESPNYVLQLDDILNYFSDGAADEPSFGMNLLFALEGLISPPLDVKPLLDADLLSCLVSILYRLLGSTSTSSRTTPSKQGVQSGRGDYVVESSDPWQHRSNSNENSELKHRLVVEGGVVHVMKALAQHPGAAQHLADDDTLQLLFQIIKMGSNFSGLRKIDNSSNPPVHRAQLHRHSIQILSLLLISDNGSTAEYIHTHQLIEMLLKSVKDFDMETGDPTCTLGVVSLLCDCLQLSSQQEAGGVRLREDLKKANGYQLFVQLALKLVGYSSDARSMKVTPASTSGESGGSPVRISSPTSLLMMSGSGEEKSDTSSSDLAPYALRLLDFFVELSQVGEYEPVTGSKGGKAAGIVKHAPQATSCLPLFDGLGTGGFEVRGREVDGRVRDTDAVRIFQDLFLRSDNISLRLEVLDRFLRLLSSHPDNYSVIQELRTIPIFVQNMGSFPAVLQERLLKVLEYAVTVVNCVPEQELLSLCYLLQQPLDSTMKAKVLSFFVKLLSFDRQYKKVLREVGLLDLLVDDLKFCELTGSDAGERMAGSPVGPNSSRSVEFSVAEEKIPAIWISRPGPGNPRIFGDLITLPGAWKCLHSLLERSEGNQHVFRNVGGIRVILPLLVSSEHRSGALRILSCLICEDHSQTHSEEFGALIRILKAGLVSGSSGGQWTLGIEATADILWAVWRILGSTPLTKGVFGETKGFALLLTTFQSLQVVEDCARTMKTLDDSQVYTGGTSPEAWKVVDALLQVVTAGASNNRLNRIQLHESLTSQTFKDLLKSSTVLCPEYEEKLVNALFDVALERDGSLSRTSERSEDLPTLENGDCTKLEDSGDIVDDIQNPGAIEVLISVLLHFPAKLQLKMLTRVDRLARVGPHNQDALTSVGCVERLLEAMHMMLGSTSPLMKNVLQIVEVLGVYRLSSSEFRTLGNYLWQSRDCTAGFVGRKMLEMFERMSRSEGVSSESISLSPFVEFNMIRTGHACMRISLGERGWPPAVGYSFACWFRYQYSETKFSTADVAMKSGKNSSIKQISGSDRHLLHILTVGTAEEKSTTCAELYMNELGVLTLATSPTSSLSFKGVRLVEGVWYNLVIVHSKPHALAGLFQSSVASLYINGNLRETGKLGYTASPPGKALQTVIGTPASAAEVCPLSWRLGPCYLFEEVLFAPAVFFLYCLGRGYRGTFQDTDLLRFVPHEACGDGNLAILEALETELMPNSQKGDGGRSSTKPRGSGIVWDMERLVGPWMQLSSRKLIFAFDGTHPHTPVTSSVACIYNLVDPVSAAASPSGGLPRFARLHGDVYICTPRSIGDNIHMVGGVAVVLALIEAAETREMLRCALSLLVNILYANPRNLNDMLSCRGYHLLALFLHRRMSLFKIQDLDLLFKIAACEASPFLSTSKPLEPASSGVLLSRAPGSMHPDLDSAALHSKLHDDDQASSLGSPFDQSDFFGQEEVLQTISDDGSLDGTTDRVPRNSIVLSNPDMMEHVLLDWTLWVTAPVPTQLYLLNFIEQLVSMHRYRVHNLTTLRRINIVQHLLVTLQRGDVETPVLEKLVVLLGILLEDGFLPAELKYAADFVVMTFDPPDPVPGAVNVTREHMSVQVKVRNMLLDMLIDLQVTISGEEVLDTWLKILSSKLITFLLDEAVDGATMRRVMTLLGVCLSSSPLFLAKFRGSGGYQALVHVLPSFYDSPEVYYMLFCLLFGKPVYPRLPEVRMLDFHALMPNDGGAEELYLTDLLESVIAMAKAVFDRMTIICQKAQESGDFTEFYALLASSFCDGIRGTGETLQGEALLHKTFAARLMSGDAAAPGLVTSLLRFMVDLAKMYHPFSVACRRSNFLECCVDLYFSCARAAAAIEGAQLVFRLAQQPQQVDQERQDNLGGREEPSNLERSEILNPGMSPLKTEKVSSEGLTDPFMGFKDQTNCMPGLSKPLNSTQQDLKAVDVAQIHTAAKFSSDETNGSGLPLKWATNESPAPSESSGFTSGLSTQKTPDSESSSVGAVNPWFGGFTPSEVSSRLQTLSSVNIPTVSSGEFDGQDTGTSGINLGNETSVTPVKANLLVQLEDDGTVGGPCSSGASAVLDLLAEIFAEVLTEQPKGVLMMEVALEAVPLYVDSDVVLVFQGLCLSRVMNVLERRLIRDDEEIEKKLDKSRWGPNLEMLSTLLVDRVYAGAFADIGGTLNVLEFLLGMLQMANRDGQVEDATPTSKGLLSLTRGGFRQVEPFVQALLKNANRMFMYSFLPSSLTGMTDWIRQSQDCPAGSNEDLGLGLGGLDIYTSLKLIVAHKKLLFCPSNLDLELTSCLCANVAPMLWDSRQYVKNVSLDVWRALLLYRASSLEELLICKGVQGEVLDIMHGGFNRLPTSVRDFLLWLDDAQVIVKKTLDQRASPIWMEFVAGAARFPGAKVRALEGRRKREMGRRLREISKENSRHWEQMVERRVALDVIREAMAAELRVMRQDKYGWVLHAESEWSGHFQELVHERGIWPMAIRQSQTAAVDGEPLWQLCTTEGPYRMRKKLERCKFQLDHSQHSGITDDDYINDQAVDPAENEFTEYGISAIKQFHLPASSSCQLDSSVHAGCLKFKHGEMDGVMENKLAVPTEGGLSDNHRATVIGFVPPSSISSNGDKSAVSLDGSFPTEGRGVESTKLSTAPATEDIVRNEAKKLDKVINDDGEYLIRPHLQPGEKLLFRYNCERVVGLDKHDGIFLIGELSLYVIEHYYIDDEGRINEKASEGELSVIDRALGVKINTAGGASLQEPQNLVDMTNVQCEDTWPGGRAWALTGGAWGAESMKTGKHLTHTWRMWKLESVHELLKRRYQLRPVAIELFSMDGCNELLVFHKEERDEVFKNLLAMNLPRNSLLDTTISGVSKHESGEGGGRIFKVMAKSFSRRWQNGEISNFQYLMHLNTLAGRGYNDLTQYPVFPWILSDYRSEELDLSDPATFRPLDKPMGALSPEREEEFRKRYESWEDPEIPRFHYGSHYSSAGSVLFYLIRLPPFSKENRHLQGGQFDHADRLFNSFRDTWLSASQGNTADVKELIPEFFYLPEFLENRFNFDFGIKQSGERVNDVLLPPWAKGSAREFVRKHREALESQYVSENLHHWIDLIFGFQQRGKPAVDATNVFFYLTYEGAVDIDSIHDPAMKASILAQINHFGQTPRQLFTKPHPKRKWQPQTALTQTLCDYQLLVPQELRTLDSSVSQIVIFHERIYVAAENQVLKPPSYSKYLAWGYQDRSLRFISYDQDKLLSTHEGLHDCGPVCCAGMSRDGKLLVTGGEDGVVAVWRQRKDGIRGSRRLHLLKALCGHTKRVTCLSVCQPYSLVVSGSLDRTVIFWDLAGLEFVRQLPELPAPASAVYANDMTGEVVTAAGSTLAVWSINGDCLAAINTSQIASDCILSITSPHLSDWMAVSWYITGHKNGSIKIWRMKTSYCTDGDRVHPLSYRRFTADKSPPSQATEADALRRTRTNGTPEYHLVLYELLSWHNEPVTAISLSHDLKQLYSGDGGGHVIAWTLPDEGLRQSASLENLKCSSCTKIIEGDEDVDHCRNCGQLSCRNCLEKKIVLKDLGYVNPMPVCRDCFYSRSSLSLFTSLR